MVAEPPLGVYSTLYPVIADDPTLVGAVHAREICALPEVAVKPVGTPGGVPAVGVTALEAVEYVPVPAALTPATRNVYAVLLVNPVTVALVDVDVPSLNVVHDDPELLLNCTA